MCASILAHGSDSSYGVGNLSSREEQLVRGEAGRATEPISFDPELITMAFRHGETERLRSIAALFVHTTPLRTYYYRCCSSTRLTRSPKSVGGLSSPAQKRHRHALVGPFFHHEPLPPSLFFVLAEELPPPPCTGCRGGPCGGTGRPASGHRCRHRRGRHGGRDRRGGSGGLPNDTSTPGSKQATRPYQTEQRQVDPPSLTIPWLRYKRGLLGRFPPPHRGRPVGGRPGG